MAKAELKLTSLGFWRGYSSTNRAGTYTELVAVAPIFNAMMNERLVSPFLRNKCYIICLVLLHAHNRV